MTFREKVSRRVIDPETRDRRITAVYMALAVLALMHHVYVTVYFPFPENGAIPFRFAWVILAGVLFVVVILVLGLFAILSYFLVPILIVIVIVRLVRMFGGTGY